MGSLTWRALGQAALIYLAIGASAVTAQDTQPGRTTFAEMIAFARLGSVACERVVPDVKGFHALALQRLIKPLLTEKEIGAKEKDVKRLRWAWRCEAPRRAFIRSDYPRQARRLPGCAAPSVRSLQHRPPRRHLFRVAVAR